MGCATGCDISWTDNAEAWDSTPAIYKCEELQLCDLSACNPHMKTELFYFYMAMGCDYVDYASFAVLSQTTPITLHMEDCNHGEVQASGGSRGGSRGGGTCQNERSSAGVATSHAPSFGACLLSSGQLGCAAVLRAVC